MHLITHVSFASVIAATAVSARADQTIFDKPVRNGMRIVVVEEQTQLPGGGPTTMISEVTPPGGGAALKSVVTTYAAVRKYVYTFRLVGPGEGESRDLHVFETFDFETGIIGLVSTGKVLDAIIDGDRLLAAYKKGNRTYAAVVDIGPGLVGKDRVRAESEIYLDSSALARTAAAARFERANPAGPWTLTLDVDTTQGDEHADQHRFQLHAEGKQSYRWDAITKK